MQNSDGEIIYRAYTDENGEIPDIPVVPGAYTFREVLAPEGFALNEAAMTFSVNAEGNVTGDTAIQDDDNRVSVLKEDEKGLPLGGAVFGLYSQQDELLMTAVSDAKGFAQFERIPNGHYTIREIQAPEGYLISREAMSLTMDGTFINPTGPLATITNAPTRIMLLKADTSGNPIPGVTFSLISAATGEVVQIAVSDENGLNVDWRGADAGGDAHGNL